MFNTLASFLLGTSNSYQDRETTRDANRENANLSDQAESSQLESKSSDLFLNDCVDLKALSCVDSEDDWLIVDKEDDQSHSSDARTDSEEELPFVEIKRSPITQRPVLTRHVRNGSGSGTGSSDGRCGSYEDIVLLPAILPSGVVQPVSSMEESWFVTPPPCFTSTGPIHMETSPLENLLIEHPSMSVYHNIRSTQDQEEDIVVLELSLDETETLPVAERTRNLTTTHVVHRRVQRVEHLTFQEVKQRVLQRSGQKAHEKKDRQMLCRGAMERCNKTRIINSKGNRPRRSDMQHSKTLSRANNNRKC